MGGKHVPPSEPGELDDEPKVDDGGTALLHQIDGGPSGTAGCEHVIDDHDSLIGIQSIDLDLETIGAVFEIVGDPMHLAGKLAGLAGGDEADTEALGGDHSCEETSGFDPDDDIDIDRIGSKGHGAT